jgi:phosphatidylglycerophosphatase A
MQTILKTAEQLPRFFALALASGLGSGYAKFAPGTFGSLAALVVWWVLSSFFVINLWQSILLVAFTTGLGYLALRVAVNSDLLAEDPGWIVIDEWAGLFLALVALAPTERTFVVVGFLLFRLFDATKWGPVGWAERLPGALGIMVDDLVAGGVAAVAVVLLRACFS